MCVCLCAVLASGRSTVIQCTIIIIPIKFDRYQLPETGGLYILIIFIIFWYERERRDSGSGRIEIKNGEKCKKKKKIIKILKIDESMYETAENDVTTEF